MAFTSDDPPIWLRDVLPHFPEVLVEECGYQHGSWATVKFPHDGIEQHLTLRRNGLNRIEIKGVWRGRIEFDAPTGSFDSVAERDKAIGSRLDSALSGYETFATALQDNCEGEIHYNTVD